MDLHTARCVTLLAIASACAAATKVDAPPRDTDPPSDDGISGADDPPTSDTADPDAPVPTDTADTGEAVPPPVAGQTMASPGLGTLVFVEAGAFTQGCVAGRDDVHGATCATALDGTPTRPVTLTRGFWMMEAEVTQSQWTALGFVDPTLASAGARRPVANVTWWETLAAANRASELEGLPACYELQGCDNVAVGAGRSCAGVVVVGVDPTACEGYRLPTEAEWEYAARAASAYPYAGATSPEDVAWYGKPKVEGTADVCTRPVKRNGFGLCDLSGNLWEWVWDRYADRYASGAATNPTGPPAGPTRVSRGGGFVSPGTWVRNTQRGRGGPDTRSDDLGFRLVRTQR